MKEPEETNKMFIDMGQVSGTDQNCSIVTTEKQPIPDGSPWSTFPMEDQATRKFDVMFSACLSSTLSSLKEHKELIECEIQCRDPFPGNMGSHEILGLL